MMITAIPGSNGGSDGCMDVRKPPGSNCAQLCGRRPMAGQDRTVDQEYSKASRGQLKSQNFIVALQPLYNDTEGQGSKTFQHGRRVNEGE